MVLRFNYLGILTSAGLAINRGLESTFDLWFWLMLSFAVLLFINARILKKL
ncbi:MAG: Uncharacterised protein [Flavobacteriaceae bacterium]|jgi:hypothetical protein|nr:MAG: Uncharacterised protein [Flavobacteriaceae bacterium]